MTRLSLFLIFLLLAGSLLAVPAKAETTSYYGLSFNTTGYIHLNSGLDLSNTTEFSIFVIAKPEQVSSGHNPLVTIYSSTTSGIWFLLKNGNVLHLGLGNGTNWFYGVNGQTVEYGKVALMGVVWDSSTVTFYYNLNKVSRTFAVNQVGNVKTTRIGWSFAYWADHQMNGTIYEVLIYNRALSDSEIQQIYKNPLNPPRDGLVLWYAPDSVDPMNNVWKDKSGNGNDGTIVGATYVPLRPIQEGQFSEAYALRFDGVDNHVTAQGISSNELSVIVLFKATNITGEHTLLDARKWGTSFGGWNLRVENGALKFITVWNDSGTYKEAGVSTSISANRVYLATAVHTGTESKLYLDGQFINSITVDGLTENSENTLLIGENRVRRGFFEGTIYSVLIYNRALSDSEIKQIYKNPLDPPKDGLVLFYNPYSYDPVSGKWLNVAPIFPTIPLAEELDAVNYGATPERVSIPHLSVYDIENNSEIPIHDVSVSLISNNTTTSLIPSLLTLPYNTTVTLNVSAPGFKPRTLTTLSDVTSLAVFLQPINQTESLNVEQAVNATSIVKNITSYVNITPINPYAKAFMDSGGSFGDTIKLALQGDSLMRLILPQVLILAIVIVVLVQTASPLAALAGALIGWAMSLGIIGEAPSMRNSGMTFMLVVFLVAWTLWDLFYNYSRET